MEDNKKQNPNDGENKSLDELLKDPNLQAEFDKKVAKALEKNAEKLKGEWKAQAEAERTEAERLAKLTESEKQKEALDKAKNLDTDLLSTIDFTKETADSVKTKLESLETVFNKAVEGAVNSKLKQSSPYNVSIMSKTEEQAYLDKKYGNSKYYNKGV